MPASSFLTMGRNSGPELPSGPDNKLSKRPLVSSALDVRPSGNNTTHHHPSSVPSTTRGKKSSPQGQPHTQTLPKSTTKARRPVVDPVPHFPYPSSLSSLPSSGQYSPPPFTRHDMHLFRPRHRQSDADSFLSLDHKVQPHPHPPPSPKHRPPPSSASSVKNVLVESRLEVQHVPSFEDFYPVPITKDDSFVPFTSSKIQPALARRPQTARTVTAPVMSSRSDAASTNELTSPKRPHAVRRETLNMPILPPPPTQTQDQSRSLPPRSSPPRSTRSDAPPSTKTSLLARRPSRSRARLERVSSAPAPADHGLHGIGRGGYVPTSDSEVDAVEALEMMASGSGFVSQAWRKVTRSDKGSSHGHSHIDHRTETIAEATASTGSFETQPASTIHSTVNDTRHRDRDVAASRLSKLSIPSLVASKDSPSPPKDRARRHGLRPGTADSALASIGGFQAWHESVEINSPPPVPARSLARGPAPDREQGTGEKGGHLGQVTSRSFAASATDLLDRSSESKQASKPQRRSSPVTPPIHQRPLPPIPPVGSSAILPAALKTRFTRSKRPSTAGAVPSSGFRTASTPTASIPIPGSRPSDPPRPSDASRPSDSLPSSYHRRRFSDDGRLGGIDAGNSTPDSVMMLRPPSPGVGHIIPPDERSRITSRRSSASSDSINFDLEAPTTPAMHARSPRTPRTGGEYRAGGISTGSPLSPLPSPGLGVRGAVSSTRQPTALSPPPRSRTSLKSTNFRPSLSPSMFDASDQPFRFPLTTNTARSTLVGLGLGIDHTLSVDTDKATNNANGDVNSGRGNVVTNLPRSPPGSATSPLLAAFRIGRASLPSPTLGLSPDSERGMHLHLHRHAHAHPASHTHGNRQSHQAGDLQDVGERVQLNYVSIDSRRALDSDSDEWTSDKEFGRNGADDEDEEEEEDEEAEGAEADKSRSDSSALGTGNNSFVDFGV